MELAPWVEKMWNTSDCTQLSPFRDLLSGNVANLHTTSQINVEESGIENDSKRHEEEARALVQAGFLTNER